MNNVLIFKTDRIGDFLNISPIISNIKNNYPNSNIFVVCSNYNYSIAKYYKNLVKLIKFEKPFYKFLLTNSQNLFKIKFDLILQLDGKNHSYLTSIFINSKKKYSIKFIKEKKLLGIKYTSYRPSYPIYKFFDHLEPCYENYDLNNNMSFHYLSLYFKLLEKCSIKTSSKKHFFPFYYKSKSNINNNYILLHIDEKWNDFDKNVLSKLISKIYEISKIHKILVTTNLNNNIFFQILTKSLKKNENIKIVENSTVDDLVNIIHDSRVVISCHSGFIVHLAACFNKIIIDTVPKSIFNELDRWIPFEINYQRYDINEIDKIIV